MKLNNLLVTCVAVADSIVASPLRLLGSDYPVRSRSSGSIVNAPLTDWIKNGDTDLQWYTSISVGTPPQHFNVLIDTGSQGLLLPSSNCTSCHPLTLFDPSKSSTFSWSPDESGPILFSTGGDTIPFSEPEGAHCTLVTDTASIQGLTATAYSFYLCDQEGAALTSMPGIDGILGLGIQDSSGLGLLWALHDERLLTNPVFGVYTPPGRATGGELTIGGVDDAKFEGELTWLDLDPLSLDHDSWAMDVQTIFISGRQLLVTSNGSGAKVPYPQSLSVLDTGTSFLMAPDYETARDIYAQISPKIYQIDPVGTWGAPCSDMETIRPELTFLLGYDGSTQLNVTIPGSSFNLGPYPGLKGICQAVINNYQSPQVNDDGRGIWIGGSPLLKHYYTAWNGLGLKVGFATSKSASSSSSTLPPGSSAHSGGFHAC
ncbi:hypothetical protein VPNG_04032 [Cytospora leucostoma]|uniref:Peptidase A1 domain-containing protein n=1 Tax=Cytospora leucostoma TaxID=1230097 RepID=A0A423XD63_9PEZI|nr:hypothetical protein VPNG_04032 [Cytospora leucostoma]